MLEALKNTQKVLACKEIKNKDKFISDDVMSFRCDEPAAVGDVFVVMSKGILKTVQVTDVYPLWRYSDSRKGLGNPDTMSWVIAKVDLNRHALMKKARAFLRDVRAAIEEQMGKAADDKSMKEFIDSLPKNDKARFVELTDIVKDVEANPEKVDEYLND